MYALCIVHDRRQTATVADDDDDLMTMMMCSSVVNKSQLFRPASLQEKPVLDRLTSI